MGFIEMSFEAFQWQPGASSGDPGRFSRVQQSPSPSPYPWSQSPAPLRPDPPAVDGSQSAYPMGPPPPPTPTPSVAPTTEEPPPPPAPTPPAAPPRSQPRRRPGYGNKGLTPQQHLTALRIQLSQEFKDKFGSNGYWDDVKNAYKLTGLIEHKSLNKALPK